MKSVKETLHHSIDILSDEEAQQILEYIQHLQEKKDDPKTLKGLASDRAFTTPEKVSRGFKVVEPIQGKGIAVSKLLVEDRR